MRVGSGADARSKEDKTTPMKRMVKSLLAVVFALFATSVCRAAQESSVERFLDRVAAHPVGDEVERDQSSREADSLNTAPRSDVERILPVVLRYTGSGSELHVRTYATMFLLAVALRSDGADVLSTHSKELASLLTDSDPVIQRVAVAITDYVIDRNSGNYVPALAGAMQKASTPQEVAAQMAAPLMRYGSDDPTAVKTIHAFLIRGDLTPDTKIATVTNLGMFDLPEEVNQDLCNRLEDADPRVRSAAIVAFANSKSNFHNEAQKRVERIAEDEKENAQVRQLAKDALAGRTQLNPNIDGAAAKPTSPQ